ncbi:glycoside hydrolase family 13 protein [Psychroflexus montanilacus]|uniref:glycoside hydrolase family 13 protein n=1 Tax=Psychroflexus montanilacus TaxID=2873598 RepID=UPI001CCC7220|nr:glycoside hydrolase family 13 protein [Psychroflexus montanilacus]MBZ9653061.1 glycoside hydrolase family 13 protein [Psychroflexus montanilacus]
MKSKSSLSFLKLALGCIFILNLSSVDLKAQDLRVEPPNWWIGMEMNEIQLLVHADNISSYEPQLNYKGVEVTKIHKADSPNYLFLDVNISEQAKAGSFEIKFKKKGSKNLGFDYELKSRQKPAEDYVGFNHTDVVYLITPDRFANGNPKNDVVKNLKETKVNREDNYARHGGDIQGIMDHLDYISDMGFTSIWSSPLLTNDMENSSYHGYAITDFYEVDPRFGDLEQYKELSKKASEQGVGLIMDMVANHCGSGHWWMEDLPFGDWLNFQEEYESGEEIPTSNHKRSTNQDPYASERDTKLNNQGWFVSTMPDLNQNNEFLANYIIQNSIWWVETLQLHGIRQDTYPYPDKAFMSDWAGAIMTEYPNFNIVGEEWTTDQVLVSYWQDGVQNKDGYESNLRSVMDFPMQMKIVQALNEGNEGWGNGLVKIYEGLANDFNYAEPKDIMIFPDNHDMDRIFTQLNEDVDKTKMALGLILTLPRTPQIYYGTEILMQNSDKRGDHGLIRTDFPGGWDGDQINAFTGENLPEDKKEFQTFLKTLLNFRKTSDAIMEGKMVHFAPFEGVYAVFRIHDNQTVVSFLNTNDESIKVNLSRFEELNLDGKQFKNVIQASGFNWGKELQLQQGFSMYKSNN